MNFENSASYASFCIKDKNDYPEWAEVSFIPVALIPSIGRWFPNPCQWCSSGHIHCAAQPWKDTVYTHTVAGSDFPQNSRFTFAYLTLPFVCSKLTMSPPKSSGFCQSQPIQPIPVHLSKLHYHLLSSPNQNSAGFVYFTSQTFPKHIQLSMSLTTTFVQATMMSHLGTAITSYASTLLLHSPS